MVLNLNKYITTLLAFTLLILGLHFLLSWLFPAFFLLQTNLLFSIYFFLLTINTVHFLGLKWLFQKWPRYSGFLFTAMSLLKMLVAFLFLFPFIFPSKTESIPLALNFMAAYLLFLFFEVVFLVKNMMKNH